MSILCETRSCTTLQAHRCWGCGQRYCDKHFVMLRSSEPSNYCGACYWHLCQAGETP